MNVTLRQQDLIAIRHLNPSDIEITTSGLRKFFSNSAWVGKTNRYASGVISRLKKSDPATVQHKRNLAQYIAASVTLHSSDGWSYLGRAVACILSGDPHRSLHLAYYAELRAAMSLLAATGIGIFSSKHFVVHQANSIKQLQTRQNTHKMAWLALEAWSTLPHSGELFAEIVRPEGHTLNQWFQVLGGARIIAPQAKAWFMQWGMDLGLAADDQVARNESTYRPDGIPTTWRADSKACLEFVLDLWTLLEPSSTSSFEQIDRHIFRHAIERHYLARTGRKPHGGDAAFDELIDETVTSMSLPPSAEGRFKAFLARRILEQDPSVFSYSTLKPSHREKDALAVISRAVLLLRLSTGSAKRLLTTSGIDLEALEFWWTTLGESRGIWAPGAAPSDLQELWADVDQALKEIAEIEFNDPGSFESFNDIASTLAPYFDLLASHERVGIWGLVPSSS